MLFRTVFGRGSARIGWAESYAITMFDIAGAVAYLQLSRPTRRRQAYP